MSAPGELIAQRYRLTKLVGTGGMGAVWEAFDERLHRTVAIKALHPQPWLSDAEAAVVTNRALREARITARLNHPHAVPVYDVVEDQGRPCLVMQFLPSEPLSSVLQRRGALPEPEVAELGAQLASALEAAHQVGIVHRDVKPGNVLVATDGTARISDFGISHALGDVTLTSTGLVAGTPEYLAPEVARGGEPGFPADVFSLGATLYAALEGRPPFGSDANRIALLHRVAAGVINAPRPRGALTSLLMEMLAADPSDRPTMSHAAATLARLQNTRSAGAHTPITAAAGLTPVSTALAPTVGMPAYRGEEPQPTLGMPAGHGEDPAPTARQQPPLPSPAAATAPPPMPGAGPPPTAGRSRLTRVKGRRRRPPPRRRGPVIVVLAAVLLLPILLLTQSWRDGQEVGAPPALPSSAPTGEATAQPEAAPTAVAAPPASTPAAPSPATSPSPSSASPPSASASSAGPTVAVAGVPTAAESVRAVTSYYALLPAGTDQAWPLMTASYQTSKAGGRASYQRFWQTYSRVTATEVSAVGPATVEATISYYTKDGRVIRERTSFGLVKDGGILKIDNSRVLRTLGS